MQKALCVQLGLNSSPLCIFAGVGGGNFFICEFLLSLKHLIIVNNFCCVFVGNIDTAS